MAYKVEARSVDRKGNPKRKFTFFGKTKVGALTNAKDYFRKTRNIKAGFYDEEGIFHPIRASSDYSPSRAGDVSEYHRRARASRPGSSSGEKRRKRNKRRIRRTAAHGLKRRNRAKNRRRTSPRVARRPNRRPAARLRTNRRRKNKMPAALARYWRTHKRTKKAKNRRRK